MADVKLHTLGTRPDISLDAGKSSVYGVEKWMPSFVIIVRVTWDQSDFPRWVSPIDEVLYWLNRAIEEIVAAEDYDC